MTTATKNTQRTATTSPEFDEELLQWIEDAVVAGALNTEEEAAVAQVFKLEDRIAEKRREKNTAPKPLYFPRAIAETVQEKKRAKILNEMVKESEDSIHEGRLALSDREELTENEAKVYEMGIKSTQVWLQGLNAAAAWAPGTPSARQASITGVDFTSEETNAIFSAAEAESSALDDETDNFIAHNWPEGDFPNA